MLASGPEVTLGFFNRLSNLGKGWIQVKKKGRSEQPGSPEVEDEIAKTPGDEQVVAKPPTPQAPPSPGEPKPDEPPTRVKKTL